MRHLRLLALAANGLLLPVALSAQTIVGRIVDEATRAPVNQADIALLDGSGLRRANALADSLGNFRLAPPVAGAYTLRVQHIAYTPWTSAKIEVGNSEVVEIEIRLGRTVIPLQPLVVTARTRDNSRLAGFNQRRRSSSFGRFLTRADIETRSASRTSDLLRVMPGVAVTPVNLRGRAGPERSLIGMRSSAGLCDPAFFIDGVRVHQSAESTLDDVLTPEMLNGVEVYTVSGAAPAQFAVPGSCGVVLFWTRQGEGNAKWSWKRFVVAATGIALLIVLLR